MPRSKKDGRMSRALRVLKLEHASDLKQMDPIIVRDIIQRQTQEIKLSIRMLIQQEGLGNLPVWRACWQRKSNKQVNNAIESLGLKTSKYRKKAVLEAMDYFKFVDVEDIKTREMKGLLESLCKMTIHDRAMSLRLLNGTNILMCSVGRNDRMRPEEISDMILGKKLSNAEKSWYHANGEPMWYTAFKESFADFLRRKTVFKLNTMNMWLSHACSIIRVVGRDPRGISSSDLNEATLAQCLNVINDGPKTLTRQGRGHRSGKDFDPIKGTVDCYFRTARLVAEVLNIPKDEIMTKGEARRRISRSPLLKNIEPFVAVDDALTTSEINTIIGYCENEKEKMVMILLGRLGMRVGAISNLRLSGVIENYNNLQPGMEKWAAASILRALDKGDQINEWYIDKIPGVRGAIEDYINKVWRPCFENWEPPPISKLTEQLIFPKQQLQRLYVSNKQLTNSTNNVIKKVLRRAGFTGARAHAHAFRKGVVTELLRSGNTLKTVSTFVHHKSTTTTEAYYDKRKREELLDKMVTPLGWEKLVDDIAEATEHIDTPEVDGTSVTNTDDRERLQFATAMLEATETIKRLKKRMEILNGILTDGQRDQYQELCVQSGISP